MTYTYETATLFQSRPQIVEAIQWTGDNAEAIFAAVGADKVYIEEYFGEWGSIEYKLRLEAGVDGVQGYVDVPVGHWLVHPPGDLSDVWPVEDEYFRNKYVPHGLIE